MGQLVGDLLFARLALDHRHSMPRSARTISATRRRPGPVRDVPGELVDDRDQHLLQQLLLGVEAVVHAGQARAGFGRDRPRRRCGTPSRAATRTAASMSCSRLTLACTRATWPPPLLRSTVAVR